MNAALKPSSEGGNIGSKQIINVMLVDDSAVIRSAVSKLLEQEPRIKIIASISNGQLAINAAKNYQPDIIVLDIEMPVMDGITALPEILKNSPKSKVIMFSTLTEKGAEITIKALSLGAVECLVKPAACEAKSGGLFQTNLINIIKNLCPEPYSPAARAPATNTAPTRTSATIKPAPISPEFVLRDNSMDYKGKPAIVAIGSSTGGPQALFDVLDHCRGFDIPIALTQHMPATFTKILAQHISQKTGIEAHEGEDGMVLENGKLYVAPGGFHMIIKKSDTGKMVIKLDEGPAINFCKPAVDPMYESLIEIHGNKVLGVILTGMGHDGLGGAKALADKGGRLIAQDKETSVVWGMPGAVAEAGLCSAVLPLKHIGPWIKKAVMG